MNYLSIPHYRGTKEKYDKSKHADGIFFTTDTHEIIANDTAYNELIKEWTISDGTLTITMTSGKDYKFVFPTASESQKGLMSKEDKEKLDSHLIDYNNPHQVTKEQVGLSNVDNTSDKNKPISTETKSALDGKINTSDLGKPNGVAQLDDTGKIPSSQLPSYVDEILEFQKFSSFPRPGESGKIYVERDTNLTYRWSKGEGESEGNYVEISPSIALGETSSTAYAGNKGADLAKRVNELAKKNISHINDDEPFTATGGSVTFNYTCFNGNDDWQTGSSHNPSLPVANSLQAGILTNTDYNNFNSGVNAAYAANQGLGQLSIRVSDIERDKVDKVEGKGLSTKDFTADLEQTLNDLNSWNYIGILSSWNGIAKLTTESTEADILTALTITPLRGNKINTKEELFAILDKCAINKKFLKESSTNAHVFVNHIGSCYVIYILGNKASVLNGKLVGTLILRSITITANSNETLAVLKNPFEINLEDINKKITEIENNINNLSIKAE